MFLKKSNLILNSKESSRSHSYEKKKRKRKRRKKMLETFFLKKTLKLTSKHPIHFKRSISRGSGVQEAISTRKEKEMLITPQKKPIYLFPISISPTISISILLPRENPESEVQESRFYEKKEKEKKKMLETFLKENSASPKTYL